MIIPGANPNVIISAKESNCLPSSPDTPNFLARKPSKKSKIAPIKIANGARSNLPLNVKMIAATPESIFNDVIKLGILNISFKINQVLCQFASFGLFLQSEEFLIYKEHNFLAKMQFKKLIFHCSTLMNKLRIIASVCLLTLQNVLAQDGTVAPKYSNEFLSIGIGADALAQGNAFAAQTNGVNSIYWNPAGLTGVNKWLEVGLMHSEYFAGIAKYDFAGLAHAIDDKSTVGFSFIRFAVDDIPNTTQLIDNSGNINYDNITTFTAADYAFLFSYARKLKREGLSAGGNFKLIHRKVGDFAKSWGFGLDAGLQYRKNEHWRYGLVARDVTSTFNAWIFNLTPEMKEVFAATGNTLPQNGLELTLPRFIFAANGKYNLGKKGIYGSGEIDLDLTTDGKRNVLMRTNVFSIDPHVGFEFGYKTYVAVRLGLSNMQYVKDFNDKTSLNIQPNIGLGLQYKNFQLDYAFTDIGDASIALYSHVFSLKLKLDKPKNVVK